MRRIRATADGAARKFAGVDGLTVSTGPRRVQTVAKASRCTPPDVFVARRQDDAPGSNSIDAETPDSPLLFGPAPLPEAERSLGAVPRCAAPVRPRGASITSSR